jgi:hypothetical protein
LLFPKPFGLNPSDEKMMKREPKTAANIAKMPNMSIKASSLPAQTLRDFAQG